MLEGSRVNRHTGRLAVDSNGDDLMWTGWGRSLKTSHNVAWKKYHGLWARFILPCGASAGEGPAGSASVDAGVTLLCAAPVGIFICGMFGAVVGVFRQAYAMVLARPLGMGGIRGFATMLTIMYSIAALSLLTVRLWKTVMMFDG